MNKKNLILDNNNLNDNSKGHYIINKHNKNNEQLVCACGFTRHKPENVYRHVYRAKNDLFLVELQLQDEWIDKLFSESEIWKYVNGSSGKYEISSHGRFLSHNYKIPRLLTIQNPKNNRSYIRLWNVSGGNNKSVRWYLLKHFPIPNDFIGTLDIKKINTLKRLKESCNE